MRRGTIAAGCHWVHSPATRGPLHVGAMRARTEGQFAKTGNSPRRARPSRAAANRRYHPLPLARTPEQPRRGRANGHRNWRGRQTGSDHREAMQPCTSDGPTAPIKARTHNRRESIRSSARSSCMAWPFSRFANQLRLVRSVRSDTGHSADTNLGVGRPACLVILFSVKFCLFLVSPMGFEPMTY